MRVISGNAKYLLETEDTERKTNIFLTTDRTSSAYLHPQFVPYVRRCRRYLYLPLPHLQNL